jgi:hypothetical protein
MELNEDEDELIPRKTFEEFADYVDRRTSFLAMLDEQHNVIRISHRRILEWEEWWKVVKNRRVARTVINNYLVSTVFLCIDHGFGGTPQWFETMVFEQKEGEEECKHDRWCWRYATWAEAEAGHHDVVELIKKGLLTELLEKNET